MESFVLAFYVNFKIASKAILTNVINCGLKAKFKPVEKTNCRNNRSFKPKFL